MEDSLRFLTSRGEIMEICRPDITLTHREVMQINGKEVTIYFKNVGMGEDTNTILIDDFEIGNLTPCRAKEMMAKLLQHSGVDLSDIKFIESSDEIAEGEEYILENARRYTVRL